MPAERSPVALAVRHSINSAVQSKPADDFNINLAGSASKILQSQIEYKETDNYNSSYQDGLRSKYSVLTTLDNNINQDNNNATYNGKYKESKLMDSSSSTSTSSCSLKNDGRNKEPRLPEPKTVLYPPNKVILGWDNNWPVGAGMYNVGNTCYLNSTLQALFHVPALVNWLLNDPHHESVCDQSDGGSECLTCAVAKTLQMSHQKSGEAFKPYPVCSKLRQICRTMVIGQQEDAHEFLRYLLEGMEKAYLARHNAKKLDSYSKETTPINQIFGGYIRTEVKCLQCKHVSTTFQHFQDILLDIRKSNSLDEALQGYFSQEQLDSNDYKCEACKKRVPATKQFSLERPPKVLCIQLKRFSVMGGKISRHIDFKPTIDIGPYVRKQSGESSSRISYKLTSMVTHMGPSVNCGHYTAVALTSSGKYYSFDDSYVRPVTMNSVLSTNAYIMIFEMESASSNSSYSSHLPTSLIESSNIKSIGYSHMNGSSRTIDSKPDKSNTTGNVFSLSNKGDDNCGSRLRDSEEKRDSVPTPPPPPPLPPIISCTSPSKIHNKLDNVNKLVDYEAGDSSDESTKNSYKSKRDHDRISPKSTLSATRDFTPKSDNLKTNGSLYSSSYSRHASRTPPPPQLHNGYSNYSSLTNGISHRNSSSPDSPSSKYLNGKLDNDSLKSDYRKKNDWDSSKRRSESTDRKVYTKASSSGNKWDDSRSSSYLTSPSSSDLRNYNGSNRSDTLSHLQKSSQWAYGNSSVQNWNGGKARIDRDVDNERRQERIKRMYDDEDDELDRGRTKKVKSYHNDFKNSRNDSNNSKYNAFQEHQRNSNNFEWRNKHNNFRHHPYYNNYNNNRRSRHNKFRGPRQRFHNNQKQSHHYQRR